MRADDELAADALVRAPSGLLGDPGTGWPIRFGTVGFANPEDWLLGLQATTDPVLGSYWDLRVTEIPPNTVFGVTIWGLSDPAILDLGYLGLPGCQLRADLDLVFGPWTPAGAAYSYNVQVPTNSALSGTVIYTQAATFAAPAVTPFGAITSNGVKGVLGTF